MFKKWISKLKKNRGFVLSITENKTLCVSLHSWEWGKESPFHFDMSWTRQQDHAGLTLDLSIFGRGFEIELHDNRHWNWREGRWYELMEESRLMKESDELRKKLQQHIDGLTLEEAKALLSKDLKRIPVLAVQDRHADIFEDEGR